jgi:hypothetical protein
LVPAVPLSPELVPAVPLSPELVPAVPLSPELVPAVPVSPELVPAAPVLAGCLADVFLAASLTPKALANFSPGLLQPWVRETEKNKR